MTSLPATLRPAKETRGLLLGFLGVACFSVTLPATVMALQSFDPFFIALGRAGLAGLLGALLLWSARARPPTRQEAGRLLRTALGIVFGFPLLTTWAMQVLPASHGAVVLGILPLLTAIAGTLLSAERPSPGFWIVGALGSATVILFALLEGGGRPQPADLALLGAIAAAAYGYAEGARLSLTLGAWQTISWTLVLTLPVTLPLALWRAAEQPFATATSSAWAGFLYVALMSQLFGFLAWYRGLAMGGVARVGQLQLLQPFLTIAFAALLLAEPIAPRSLVFALLVILLVALGRRMPVRRGA